MSAIMPAKKAIITFFLAALFLCMEMAIQVSPSVMASQLMNDLRLTAFGLGLMSGAYFVTYTLMQIPSGLLYDRLNFRNVVCATIVVCALGAGVSGVSIGLLSGALGRLLTGFGSAFAFLSVLTVAARYFQQRYFAVLAGIAQLLAALGAIGGEFPIAWLVHHFGWRHTMFILMFLGFILASILWFFLRKSVVSDHTTVRKNESVKESISAIGKNKQTWFIALYAFFNWAPVTAFTSLWGVPFLEKAYHFSTIQAASYVSLTWLGIGLLSPLAGLISDIIGHRKPILILTSLLGFISITCVVYVPHLSLVLLAILLFLAGVGSTGQLLSFAVIRDINQKNRVSTAIGFNNMAVVASGILVQPLVGGLIDLFNQSHSQVISVLIFQKALLILPIAFFICLILSILYIKESLSSQP